MAIPEGEHNTPESRPMSTSIFPACVVALILSPVLSGRDDAQQIRNINAAYVREWLRGSEEGVLSLFEQDASIMPGGSHVYKGIGELRGFWFPKDSSTTRILKFTSDILSVTVDGDMAQSTQKTFLSWTYEKGTVRLARDQWTYELTIYRRQSAGGWKIWQQLWTDVKVVDK